VLESEDMSNRLWTPANIVTLLRICGVPVLVIALISPWASWFPFWNNAEVWKEWVCAGVFIVLAATDALDGYLARSRNEITNFGKFVDPLADKILVAGALLALIELGVLPSWVALFILIREFIVSGLRMVAASKGVVIAASWYGKWKTVFQIIAIVLFIIKDSHMVSSFSEVLADKLYLISWGVMIIALILTVISMLDYFVKSRHLLGFGSSSRSANMLHISPKELLNLSQQVVEAAQLKSITLGTAESCTGGLIAETITQVEGCSDVFLGSIVSYSNQVKSASLKVSQTTLKEYGAVSKQTALEMAQGAKSALGADLVVSVTGIAGPGGGSEEKPVGTVWIGLVINKVSFAFPHLFEGDREQVRKQATYHALKAILQKIA